MQVKVFCNNDDIGMPLQSDYKKAASDFTKRLRKEIKKNQGRKIVLPTEEAKTTAGRSRSSGYNARGSVLSAEDSFVDGSGVIGPLRAVQTPRDEWG